MDIGAQSGGGGLNKGRVENRWSARKAVDLDVSVYYRGEYQGQGRGLDLSLEGMFLEMDRPYPPKGSAVELHFDLPDDQEGQSLHLRAVVIYHNNGGCGLMFIDHDLALFRYVRRLLYGHGNAVDYQYV